MFLRLKKIDLLIHCLVISILVHSVAVGAMRMLGSYRFGAAVGEAPIMVSLADRAEHSAAPEQKPLAHSKASSESSTPLPEDPVVQERTEESPAEKSETATSIERQEIPEGAQAEPELPTPVPHAAAADLEPEPEKAGEQAAAKEADPAPPAPAAAEAGPAVAASSPKTASAASATMGTGAFVSAKAEKLTYLISMMGLPVGQAELEAKNDEYGTIITLKVRSNPALSSVYPVDDFVETRQVDGKYLMSTVRQREGAFRADETLSINLVQKRISWHDNIRYRNLTLTIPTNQVLDTLSGIYSLRKRPLQVGKTETLQIFDNEKYAEVPIEIMRREEMRLPNLSKVNTLVVRPLQKTAGLFRRTGDILIWMTDDEEKVPVKIVTTIALGRVTAELVSAESQQRDPVVGKAE